MEQADHVFSSLALVLWCSPENCRGRQRSLLKATDSQSVEMLNSRDIGKFILYATYTCVLH